MPAELTIRLKKGKEQSIHRKHPWIFSGAIAAISGKAEQGALCKVFDAGGKFLAAGHYHEGSIAVRILTFEDRPVNQQFWDDRIQQAWKLRRETVIKQAPETDAFRLLHAEGDGLPGLIIDLYGPVAVVQCHSIGMFRHRKEIVSALQNAGIPGLEAIYLKSQETLPGNVANQETTEGWLAGNPIDPVIISENGCRYNVHLAEGQKTGFFLDQRENRKLLQGLSKGKSVLNTFSYSGGFSIAALRGGARQAVSVDSSKRAVQWAEENAKLNRLKKNHEAICSDVFEFLKQTTSDWDILVLDPPAFAKHQHARHNAVQAYKRLNKLGLERLVSGGLLFTFSCSQVIDAELFLNTVTAAAIESGRTIKVLHRLSQPADHPVNIFHPEGSYLKGLALWVE